MLYKYLLNELTLCLYSKASLALCVFEWPNKEHLHARIIFAPGPTFVQKDLMSTSHKCSSHPKMFTIFPLLVCLQIPSFVCYFKNQHVRNHGSCFALNNDQKLLHSLRNMPPWLACTPLQEIKSDNITSLLNDLPHQYCIGLESECPPCLLPPSTPVGLVHIRTPRHCEYDLIWRKALYRFNSVNDL